MKKTLIENQRLYDIVRYYRGDALVDGLINKDEYAELAQEHAAVARLEDYDQFKFSYREVIRLLMYQVREEQAAREALARALVREEVAPVPIPDDTQVSARIKELLEVVKNNLTEHTKGSSI